MFVLLFFWPFLDVFFFFPPPTLALGCGPSGFDEPPNELNHSPHVLPDCSPGFCSPSGFGLQVTVNELPGVIDVDDIYYMIRKKGINNI